MNKAVCRLGAAVLCCVLATAARGQGQMTRPAILRLDGFMAMRYDERTVLVMFAEHDVPASLGVPAPGWALAGEQWARGARLQLVRHGGEAEWAGYWPGGMSMAPRLGAEYVLALGGEARVHGTLSNYAFLPLCGETWLAGLVTVRPPDREIFGQAETTTFVAYGDSGGEQSSSRGWPAMGGLLQGNELEDDARTNIEAALQAREQADYAGNQTERQSLAAESGHLPLLMATDEDSLLDGSAHLSYTAQRVSVDSGLPHFYVRGVWRSRKGQTVYRVTAWFTAHWKLESVVSSGMAMDAAENEHIVNVFAPDALQKLEPPASADKVLLLEESGAAGEMYSLRRWRQDGLPAMGIYFASSCGE